MASSINTLMRKLLNVNSATFTKPVFTQDYKGQWHLVVQAKLNKKASHRCPKCGKKCSGYDRSHSVSRWRALDIGGIILEIECATQRIECHEHGVLTQAVPWAYEGSSFTKDFDLTVAWLATNLSRSTVCELMRID